MIFNVKAMVQKRYHISTINTGRLEIEYEETGPADAEAVILIRGLGTQLIHWPEEFPGAFAAAGFRTIRFDNRDTGLSSKFDQTTGKELIAIKNRAVSGKDFIPPYILDDMVMDVIHLMDALNINKAHIVGISMGGIIAQILASKYSERMLSLTSIMSGSRSLHFNPDLIKELWVELKDRDEAIEEWVEYVRSYGSKGYAAGDEHSRRMGAAAYDRCYSPDGANRQLLAICAMPNIEDLVKTISVPTLVVHGADDLLIPPQWGKETAKLIPGAKFELVDGMGHDIPPALGEPLAAIVLDHIIQTSSNS